MRFIESRNSSAGVPLLLQLHCLLRSLGQNSTACLSVLLQLHGPLLLPASYSRLYRLYRLLLFGRGWTTESIRPTLDGIPSGLCSFQQLDAAQTQMLCSSMRHRSSVMRSDAKSFLGSMI
mmetsp:Transcript_75139/g.215220  ORF Transcript_75139/g.215220 Transcript_75139/m.215220 type:complete len:120 (+) Transcript_75139:757-1116(+)